MLAMLEKPGWPEVESKVYLPGRGIGLAIGAFFVLVPSAAVFFLPFPGFWYWFTWSIARVMALLGGAVVVSSLRDLLWPPRVRRAAPDVLADVPDEPVVLDGSVVQSWRTHELVEDAAGWEFRPAPRLRRAPLWLLIFATPFLAIFSAAASWGFHVRDDALSWPSCILRGTSITLLFGGFGLCLFALMTRAAHRQLSRLSIPKNGDPLELDLAELPDPARADLASGLKWLIGKDQKRQRLSVPRELVRAVQLCPWLFSMGSDREPSRTWAVQGLLVVEGREAGRYYRLPFVLSSDLAFTARLMQQLAETLDVPYLFGADEAGWQLETRRAAARPPIKFGMM
jgi:hypothetical protein